MQMDSHAEGAQCIRDTGLICLVMLARFHNIAVTAEQLAHEFGEDGRCFGKTALLLAARHLSLKARYVSTSVSRLTQTPLPAIAFGKDGEFFIIARLEQGRVLTHNPSTLRQEVISLEAIEQRWTGELILVRTPGFIHGRNITFRLHLVHPRSGQVPQVAWRGAAGFVRIADFRAADAFVFSSGHGQGIGAPRALDS